MLNARCLRSNPRSPFTSFPCVHSPSACLLCWKSLQIWSPSTNFFSCFIIEFWKYYLFSGYNSSISYIFGKYVLLVYGLSFHSLKNVFWRAILWWGPVYQFLKMYCVFDIISKSLLNTKKSLLNKDFLLCFLLECL